MILSVVAWVCAFATPVTIDPVAYPGPWDFQGVRRHGAASFDLAPGTYGLTLAGTSGGTGTLTVHADGTVDLAPASRFHSSGSTAYFHNAVVEIDTVGFTGEWSTASVSRRRGGTTAVFVPNAGYLIQIHPGSFAFQVLADGTVQADGIHAEGLGDTLTFVTTPVSVDVGDYAGLWTWHAVRDRAPGDAVDVPVVPAMTYEVDPGGVSRFRFVVDADGVVESLAPASAYGDGDTLRFETLLVDLWHDGFVGTWTLDQVFYTTAPSAQAYVVPGLTYLLIANSGPRVTFVIGPECPAIPPELPLVGSVWRWECAVLDADGDGILDDEDACDDSASGAVVGDDGCSGVQAIEAACGSLSACGRPCPHGAFVSCVARTSNEARWAGLIDARERAAIVSGAARCK